MVLQKQFFERKTQEVAKGLIGHFLVRDLGSTVIKGIVTETEAYDGSTDLACHGSKGITKRTKVMFGEAGIFYVYFTYGMHWMLNVVTGPVGYPAAVLIRGLDIVSGPGKLTKALAIDKSFYGKHVSPETGLWFEENEVTPRHIIQTPRIGVDYSGKWAKKPWRYVLTQSRWAT